jgi:hypothetical protein
MRKNLLNIQEKIDTIQSGLLRFGENGKTVTLHVKVSVQDGDILHCVVVSDQIPNINLIKKKVTLIQKDRENYMYIGGQVTAELQKNSLYLAIDIKKACWFVRKSRGNVSWLQEKCVYFPQVKMAS